MPDIDAEKAVARRLTEHLLAQNLKLRVWDGEEFTTTHPVDQIEVVMADLASTDLDRIYVYSPFDQRLGYVQLVWGNSPEELVQDYSLTLREILGEFA
jgi:hypothetical protein